MADYGFRLMSGASARDLLDPASQRSAIEELTRFRHRRAEAAAEAVAASRHARTFGDGAAAAAAATALGMPASAGAGGAHGGGGGGGRHRGSSAHSGGAGPAEGDPWFSLRPSQPSRQQVGLAMPGGRVVRQTIGRSEAAGRR